jgi:hypothetical protein
MSLAACSRCAKTTMMTVHVLRLVRFSMIVDMYGGEVMNNENG